ncbi:hypothetical protein PR048_005171 [Dryococelus australis]|uniref:Uncharacterized protein n=1 Tax=Dryococelus australis TaxID=614101 RepID=A0ABQ9I7F0_9NEOP|nr:hypothetical protein PR048_005171 [Dryococelus australis]
MHTLNLVLSRAYTVPAIRNTFTTVKELIRYVLKQHVYRLNEDAKRTHLLRFCDTRWLEHLDSLLFKELCGPVCEAQNEIQSSSDSCDLASSVKHAESVQEEVQQMRNKVADRFRKLYCKAKAIADFMGMTIEVPRILGRK